MSKGFRISDGKGFHITFANGWTVSVQFGPGNYADNYRTEIKGEAGKRGSSNAEVAAWDANGEWFEFDKGGYTDTVIGHQTPADVLAFMNQIAALPEAEGR